MTSEFSITEATSERGAVDVLRVKGRLDARSAQMLMKASREKADAGSKHLVINLSGVSFVASSGVGTLLALTEEFSDRGGGVHLVALSEPVQSVVELLNLTQFLKLGATEAEALEAIEA